MVTVDVREARSSILSAFSGLKADEVQKLTNRAINRALSSTKTEASKLIREIYKIPKKNTDGGMFIKKAYGSTMTGYLMASPDTLPLGIFNPSEIRDNVITKKVGTVKGKGGSKSVYGSSRTRLKTVGVMIEIFKGRKMLIKSAFLSLKAKGGATVKGFGMYQSDGFKFDNTAGISQRLKTKSVLWAILNEGVEPRLSNKAQEVFSDRLLHELTRATKAS